MVRAIRNVAVVAVFGGLIQLAPTQAFAADLGGSVKDIPVYDYAPAFSWTGLYIGGHVGGAWSDVSYSHNQPGSNEPLSFSPSGIAGGAQAGYQQQFGNIVAGVELSYTALDLNSTQASAFIADRSRTVGLSDLFMATARLGYAQDRWLVYAKGGYASAELDISSNVISAGLLTASSGNRESGWTVGGGVEFAMTNNIILGVEYDYVQLNPDDRFNVGGPGFGPTNFQGINADINLLTARLSYKF